MSKYKADYGQIEQYMLSCMDDSAHDKEHIYRVLYMALNIAEDYCEVDYDILIVSCLLHDIGRKEQFDNPNVCHAVVGGQKAYDYLMQIGWTDEFAQKVKMCIVSHRYRTDIQPQSIEAKILFDSDKLDVTGAIGIARTLFYAGQMSVPLYTLNDDGTISDGSNTTTPSFLHEYRFKLEKIYDKFYTQRGAELAKQRQTSAKNYYNSILAEVESVYGTGIEIYKHVSQKTGCK